MPKLISVGELIDQSWETFRTHAADYLSMSGWLLLIAIVEVIALAFYPTVSTLAIGQTYTGPESFGVILYGINSLILSPIISLWVLAALCRYHVHARTGSPATLGTVLQEAWKYFFPVLFVSILVLLAILGGVFLGFAPPYLLATIGAATKSSALIILSNVLLIFGIILAMVLTVRWGVLYLLAPYANLLEDARGKTALRVARALTEQRFWAVLIRVLIPKLVFVLLGVLILTFITFLAGIFITGISGINLDLQLRLETLASSVLPILAAILINPLIVIADIKLFESLKATQ